MDDNNDPDRASFLAGLRAADEAAIEAEATRVLREAGEFADPVLPWAPTDADRVLLYKFRIAAD